MSAISASPRGLCFRAPPARWGSVSVVCVRAIRRPAMSAMLRRPAMSALFRRPACGGLSKRHPEGGSARSTLSTPTRFSTDAHCSKKIVNATFSTGRPNETLNASSNGSKRGRSRASQSRATPMARKLEGTCGDQPWRPACGGQPDEAASLCGGQPVAASLFPPAIGQPVAASLCGGQPVAASRRGGEDVGDVYGLGVCAPPRSVTSEWTT